MDIIETRKFECQGTGLSVGISFIKKIEETNSKSANHVESERKKQLMPL
jgi:hypothetical protein